MHLTEAEELHETQTAKADVSLSITGGQQAAAKVSGKSIALYSPEYYYTCALGGVLACGTTHALVTPLDLVKCRKQ